MHVVYTVYIVNMLVYQWSSSSLRVWTCLLGFAGIFLVAWRFSILYRAVSLSAYMTSLCIPIKSQITSALCLLIMLRNMHVAMYYDPPVLLLHKICTLRAYITLQIICGLRNPKISYRHSSHWCMWCHLWTTECN